MKTKPDQIFLTHRRKILCGCLFFLSFVLSVVAQQTPVIATGNDFTAIVDESGSLFIYGENNPAGPLLIEPAGVWTNVSVAPTDYADAHILAIRNDGTLWAWGVNSRGQLGNFTTTDSDVPVQVPLIADCVEVACGEEFSIARVSSGAVFTWGDNTFGQIGQTIRDKTLVSVGGNQIEAGVPDSPLNIYPYARPFDASNTYISIAAAITSGVGIRSDGSMHSWGYGPTYQLGLGGAQYFPFTEPQRIGNSSAWTKVFSGADMHFALQGGKLYAWGAGAGTQDGLGQGVYAPQVPARVGNFSDWVSIAIGTTHTLGLRSDGSLYGWGLNTEGQLGFAVTGIETARKYEPFLLLDGQTFLAVGAGDMFSTIVSDTSPPLVKTSGVNDVGQLGLGYTSTGSDYSFDNDAVDFGLLYTIDLALDSVDFVENPTFPGVDPESNLIAGGLLYISVEMSNLSAADLTDDFELGAKLSPTPFYDDPRGIALNFADGADVTTDIDAGESVVLGFRLELPTTLDSGEYYLVLRGDSAVPYVLDENLAARDNNDVASSTLLFYPDVTATVDVTTVDFNLGGTVNSVLAIENVGSWSTTVPFDISAVLSPVAFFDGPGEIPLTVSVGETVSANIDPSESINAFVSVTLPASIADGCYYLIYRLDDADVLGELVVLNNDVLVGDQICFGPDLADLVVTNVQAISDPLNPSDAPASNLIAGGQLVVSMDLGNIGASDITTDFDLEAVLSRSTYFDDPDVIPLVFVDGQSVTEDIVVGGTVPVGARFQLPASIPHGTYNLIIRGDSGEVLTEVTRANNDGALDALEFTPDIALSMEVLTEEFVAGGTVDAIVTVGNVGSWTAVGGFDLSAVMVTTPFYDGLTPVDLTITSNPTIVDDVDPGESIQVLVSFTLPATIAEDCYYLALRADDARVLDELVLTNNDSVTEAICFGSTDADLVVSAVTALESPTFPEVDPLTNLIAGGELIVSIDLNNIGETDITDDFELQAFLSPSAFYQDPAAIPLVFIDGETVDVDIAADSSATVGARLALPASIEHGEYNFIILGDSGEVLTEITRVNNDASLDGLEFIPDVSIGLEVLDDSFTVGEEIDVLVTLENVGSWTAVADFDLTAVLGTTPYYDGLAAQLLTLTGDTSITEDLNPGEIIEVELSVLIPLSFTDEEYYLIFRADDARLIDEIVISNNDAVAESVLNVGVDITIPTIALDDLTPSLGNDLSATVFIENLGSRDLTESFDLRAVLSLTTDFDDPDAIPLLFDGGLTEFEVTTDIGSQDSISVPLVFEFPASLDQGSYYLILCADPDDSVSELNELNNCIVSETVFELLPDITFDPATGVVLTTPGVYAVGDPMEITLNLENTGEGTIPEGVEFDVRVFLSPTTQSEDTSAVELFAAYTHTVGVGGFAPSDSLPIVLNVNLPLGLLSGDYYLGAVVDVNEDVAEQTEILDDNNLVLREDGEANNAFFTPATVVTFVGIDLNEAMDQPGNVFTTSGAGTWFGQDQTFTTDNDAAQSPAIDEGESASFSTSFAGPVVISFDWSSQTSSSENKLVFSIIGGGSGITNVISGDSAGWSTITRLVPAGAQVKWEYIEGVDAENDVVYVDNLVITTVTDPDLVIDGIDLTTGATPIETGSYVLLRDALELTVNARNQGVSTGAENAVLSVYLSTDRTLDRGDGNPSTVDDYLVRQTTLIGPFPGGNPSVTGLVIDLPADITPGDYYLIAYIDDYTDEDGVLLPGIADSTGEIAEYTTGTFFGDLNNTFISADPIVEIVARADLIVSDLNSSPNYYRIEDIDPSTSVLGPNSLEFDFTLSNVGLSEVSGNVGTKVVFSRDQVVDLDSDYTLLNYTYTGNFAAVGGAPANTRLISPDAVDFRQDVVTAGYIGERLFMGVYVDSLDDVTELNETNNGFFNLSNDFILSELPLVDGLDLDSVTIADQNVTISNDESAPYDSLLIPWVGQTTETFDGVDAVTNVLVGDDETSEFSVNIEPVTGVRVSFWWKVSSQNELIAGLNQRDVLRFSVNDVAAVPDIYGTDVDEWRRVEITLPAGSHELKWSYIKDDQGEAGEDRGWVDNLIIEDLPNLIVSGISANGSLVYAAGNTIDTWSVTVENTGDAIEPGTAFDISVRLLPQNQWLTLDSIELLTIVDSTGLAAGESRTYNQSTDGVLTLPAADYTQEFYFFGAYVDWSLGDLTNGQISESNETDNTRLSDAASVQIGLPDLISLPVADGPAITGIVGPYEFSTPSAIDLVLNLNNGGEGALLAGSEFEVVVYAAISNDELLIDSSSTFELARQTVSVATAVAAGGDLDPIAVSTTLPYGIANGNYFVGVVIDTTDSVEEQGALPSVLVPDQTREDGEGNNIFFTPNASFVVTGISLQDALEDGVTVLETITLDGDAYWFGRDNDGDDSTPDDDQVFTDNEGAQSPELVVGEQASFSLEIPDSSVVSFEWGIDSGSDENVLSLYLNGVEIRSISGDVGLATVDPSVLVPDGSILTWVYKKNAPTTGDAAYVDNITLASNSLSDLVLTNIDYVPGTYVLDVSAIIGAPEQKLGTNVLDITVEAENQGEDLPLGVGVFTSADLEVRLSLDRIYGNEDDIILGSFGQVEGSLGSGDLLRFVGGLPLRDDIPEDTYYLIAKIDSNDRVSEFSDSNNIFITENRDVTIEARPRLLPYDISAAGATATDTSFYTDVMDYDESKLYTPSSTMRVALSISNYGLDDLIDDETGELVEFINELYIVAVDREALEDYIADPETDLSTDDFEGLLGGSLIIDDFSVKSDLKGRRDGFPDGDHVNLDLELLIPNAARLDSITGDKSVDDFVYFLRLVIDSPDDILESGLINVWNNVDVLAIPTSADIGAPFFFPSVITPFTDTDDGLFSITSVYPINEAAWEAIYGVTADATGSAAEQANFLAYAFNRNPGAGDTVSNQFPGSYGFETVAGVDYLALTFDFQYLVNDLIYIVQATDDLANPWVDVATINTTLSPGGGFTEGAGEFSLTAPGGLIDSDPNITSITDLGTSARITVIDDLSSSGPGARFMRVSVLSADTTPVPNP